MSADNGIYILKTKDQYRVGHFQAIENLYHTYENGNYQELFDPVPTRIIEHYGNVKYTRNKDTALKIAYSMLMKLPVCEYGIKVIAVNKTWKQIVNEAKHIAISELRTFSQNLKHYKYNIERLDDALTIIHNTDRNELIA